MRAIPEKFLNGTCIWEPKKGERYTLHNIRIDINNFGMMEATTNQFTSAGQYVLTYQTGISEGLPEGKFFSIGDNIYPSDKTIGPRIIKRIEHCVGLYDEINHYKIILN